MSTAASLTSQRFLFNKPLHVLHLVGSATSDFYTELSLLYARECLAATADPQRYRVLIAYITPDQQWRFPRSLSEADIASAELLSFTQAVQFLSNQPPIDVALPQMFCLRGMTEYRTILQLLEIPFIGNLPAQMAIAADKAKAKAIVAAAGISVPKGELLRPGNIPTLSTPAIVKPNIADNSFGVTLVHSAKDYPAALEKAFSYSSEVLVEQFIELGREVRCGVIERDNKLITLPLVEYLINEDAAPIRTYDDKLRRTHSKKLDFKSKERPQSRLVASNDPDIPAVWSAALRCHQALGCRHYSLFDFRIDPDGRPWFIEAGLYCSFAPESVLSLMSKAHNIPLRDFFDHMITTSLNSTHSNLASEEKKTLTPV